MERQRTGGGGPEKPAAQTYEIGGRRFVELVESTWERELEYMALYSESGLGTLTLLEHEEPDEFAQRIQDELLKTRKIPEMLGCLLMPEERVREVWTPMIANETAAFLRRSPSITADDRIFLGRLVVRLVLDFFERGMISFSRSRKSSPQESGGPDHPADSDPGDGTGTANGGLSPAS